MFLLTIVLAVMTLVIVIGLCSFLDIDEHWKESITGWVILFGLCSIITSCLGSTGV